MADNHWSDLLARSISAALVAGEQILEVYQSDFDVELKTDQSPLTLADRRSHAVIVEYLKATGIPILSEEGRQMAYEERRPWKALWIVDPLDGTKEFVKRNGEFTVNIALVEDGRPRLGVVYAPVHDLLYFSAPSVGAYRLKAARDNNSPPMSAEFMATAEQLPHPLPTDVYYVVASRSHLTPDTQQFIDRLREQHPRMELVSRGSSLKLCLVAEGSAHIYPRFAPTMEWDTAAGHAVVSGAGGQVIDAHQKTELVYNKPDLLNPYFIVLRENEI